MNVQVVAGAGSIALLRIPHIFVPFDSPAYAQKVCALPEP